LSFADTSGRTQPGNVALRVASKLRHIGIGRTYARTCVLLLVQVTREMTDTRTCIPQVRVSLMS
jgi:hypothetical protein